MYGVCSFNIDYNMQYASFEMQQQRETESRSEIDRQSDRHRQTETDRQTYNSLRTDYMLHVT